MRPSRKVWIILGFGIIVVLLVVVFMVYFQQVAEKQQLNEQLDAAKVLSIKLETDEEDLEKAAPAQHVGGRRDALGRHPDTVVPLVVHVALGGQALDHLCHRGGAQFQLLGYRRGPYGLALKMEPVQRIQVPLYTLRGHDSSDTFLHI